MNNKIQYNSPVILTYTIISFIALGLGYITEHQITRLFFSIYRSPMTDPLFYIRLLGHAIGHADWKHYASNFMMLLIIGPILEEKYGSKRLLSMMLITALVTGILNLLLFKTALLGASGIVFMLILLSSFVNTEKGKIPLTFILVIIIYIGGEIFNAVLVQDNISRLTHIVGGICGGIFGYRLYNGGPTAKAEKNRSL